MGLYMNPYDKIINEYFDISDNKTRRHLLSLNEGDEQNKLLVKLTTKLYEHITNKITDIDFGSIPNSKGDITKLDNYSQLMECVDVIDDILVEYRQSAEIINIVKTAIDNIERRTNKFELAFKLNNELPVIIYTTTVYSIIASISFLISSSIEYIKIPGSDDFSIVVDRVSMLKTRENLLFDNLKKFNKSCAKGEMDKVLDTINKNGSKQMLGVVDTYLIMNITVLSAIALSIIPFIRELIYFFYYSRVKISDYLDIQAELLQMNIYNIDRNNPEIDENEKEKIKKSQSKIVSIFKTLSNKIAISTKKSENDTLSHIKKDSTEKYSIDDVDNNSVLF